MATRGENLAAAADGAPGGAGAPVARIWRGKLLAPKVPHSDSAACLYATFCPCLTFGETYQRAFNLPRWTVPLHAIVWFFGLSAMWIAAAAINGQCARMTPVSMPLPPPGVKIQDIAYLRTSNYTTGFNGKPLAPIFWGDASNATATYIYMAKVETAVSGLAAIGACSARLSPTLTGVFLLTFAVLAYGAVRRGQLRKRFGLPGDTCGDWSAWLFCTQCALCQEYRTVRMYNVDNGEWGGNVGWLLNAGLGDGSRATITGQPPDVEMNRVDGADK